MMIGMSYQTKEIEKLTEEFLIDNQGNVLGYVKSENKTISVNEIDSIELA
jgi:putative aminopeptidase FrvX